MTNSFIIGGGGKEITSRLFVGTGKFSSHQVMKEALEASDASLVTVALRRVDFKKPDEDILHFIDRKRFTLLPNTSGARTAKEAIFLARLAREAGLGDWVKLEVIPDPRYLMPDPLETLEAARTLTQEGFAIFPYIQADPTLAKRLEDVGCPVVMPMASPIGSNRGLQLRETLRIIIEQSNVPIVIDAGLGVPSHACEAMEMGADAVLVNTAIATAQDPVSMAGAFKHAVIAGRRGFLAGRSEEKMTAQASSALEGMIRP
ncbi:MAG: thiazole synthase [Deltaproteobacteria bacterium]|nr:MAG: thiazole synthase [Deltaproteobacteria bacterium]